MSTDPLTEHLLEQEADKEAHPDDYRYIHHCVQCGKERLVEASKTDIDKAREFYSLRPGTLVHTRGCCADCQEPDEE